MDEIRDIGAGSQLVELLVSEAPNLFQEAYRLLTERLRMVHKRLSCDGSDEGKQKPMWMSIAAGESKTSYRMTSPSEMQ